MKTESAIRPWTARRILAVAVGALVLAIGLSLFSTRAWAVIQDNTNPPGSRPGYLQLNSNPDPAPADWMQLSPGGPVRYWTVDASLTTATTGSLVVQLQNTGGDLITHVNGLTIGVRSCTAAWTDVPAAPTCGPGGSTVWAQQPVTSIAAVGSTSPEVDLNGLTDTQGKFLLVSLALPDSPAARADKTLQGLTASLGFGITAGETTTVVPPPSDPPATPAQLAFTGVDILAPLLVAAGALVLGIAILGGRRARRTLLEGPSR